MKINDLSVNLSAKNIPEMALLLMLAGILLPTALYSFRLQSPSAPELLVAVSVALFASVLFLWILDATDIMPFRAPWISKSVYGAAIVSILGTSVAVYKDYFYLDKHPAAGLWEVTLTNSADPTHPKEFPLLLSFSEAGDRYWGYSALIANSTDSKTLVWVEAVDVSPRDGNATLRLHFGDGSVEVFKWTVSVQKKGKYMESTKPSSGFDIQLHRPA